MMSRGPMGWPAGSRDMGWLHHLGERSTPAAGPVGQGQGVPWWGKQERPVMVNGWFAGQEERSGTRVPYVSAQRGVQRETKW